MVLYNTRDVAQLLGVTVSKLTRAIWDRRVDPPIKSPSGAYLWTIEDLERVSWQLLGHAYRRTQPLPSEVLAEQSRLNGAIREKRRNCIDQEGRR